MLEELTDDTIETQLKWLSFMLERVGHNNLPRLLDYYKSIAWISPAAAEKLLELSNQIKRYNGTSWTLSPQEHRISSLYIEKLKGGNIKDSLLTAPLPARARPDLTRPTEKKQLENIHPAEKNKMEITIHRREVTINNLEQELKDKDVELRELKEKITELELLLDGCQKELQRDQIYREILDQNIQLKKVGIDNKDSKGPRKSEIQIGFKNN